MSQSDLVFGKDIQFSWLPDQKLLFVPSLRIGKGESVLIHGPSGSGKTTLLSLLSGLAKPQSGELKVCGQNLNDISGAALDRWRARSIAYIFQTLQLIPYLTGMENVLLGAKWSGADVQEKRVQVLAKRLRIEAVDLFRRADQLSVGQQQRLAILRALISSAPLILADEMSSALDKEAEAEVMDLLTEEMKASGRTLILVSHRSLPLKFDQDFDLLLWKERQS